MLAFGLGLQARVWIRIRLLEGPGWGSDLD